MSTAYDQAMVHLITTHPWYAVPLLTLDRFPDETQPTAWTDGRRMGYNPAFFENLPRHNGQPLEVVGTLAHESSHILGRDFLRRGHRDPVRWNICCDAVINAQLVSEGFKLPKGCVPGVENTTPEYLYDHMPPELEAISEMWDEVRDLLGENGRPLTSHEHAAEEMRARGLMQQAAMAAKRHGTLSAEMRRRIDGLLQPQIPGREILQRFVTEAQRTDYSWSRPNRRYLHYDIYLPDLHELHLAKVAMACDTSGSISGEQLTQICSEVLGIMNLLTSTPELLVLWCDTKVSAQTVSDERDLDPVGGGGTSFAPVFRWLAEREDPVRAVLYVTDGCCDDFGEPPPCEVLWVLLEENPHFQPPFGEIAYVLG